MAATAIIIAQTQSDIAGHALAAAIERQAREEFQVLGGGAVTVDRAAELLGAEASRKIVLLLGLERDVRDAATRLSRAHPATPMLRIALDEAQLQIDLDSATLGLTLLLSLLRELARTLDADGWDATRAQGSAVGAPHTVPSGTAGWQSLVHAWIDEVFKLHFSRWTETDAALAGLALGRPEAERLLAGASSASPQALEALARAEQALFAALDSEALRDTPPARLRRRLGLADLEMKALLLCLAPELGPRFQKLFGYLNDDLGRRHATAGLVGELLGAPEQVRGLLGGDGRLAAWRLLSPWLAIPVTGEDALRVDGPLVGYLLTGGAIGAVDSKLRALVRNAPWPAALSEPHGNRAPAIRRLAGLLGDETATGCVLLYGARALEARARLEQAAILAAKPLLRIEAALLAGLQPQECDELADRALRAAILDDAIVVVDASMLPAAGELSMPVARFLDRLSGPGDATAIARRRLVVIAPDVARFAQAMSGRIAIAVEIEVADAATRARAFIAAAQTVMPDVGAEAVHALANVVTLPLDRAGDAARLAGIIAASETPPVAASLGHFERACRQLVQSDVPHGAIRLEPRFTLDQVVLPADRRRMLDQIVAQVRGAATVLDTWGFGALLSNGRGVTALFNGPSGTGKTMAAQAIAHALGVDVCLVDLSRVVSKYIGDTPKHMDEVFTVAERSGSVLQIDEADALFGRRSETKDAHDRYANIEVAYLLQRLEAYTGLAILTTNFRQNIDQAFLRRFRFDIAFAKPDAAARELIWRQCLPAAAPRAPDLDLRTLARRFELTGGNIKQIALNAAFAAAADGGRIEMPHVLEATRAELVKLNMTSAARELAERVA